jgi:hypothetical protein
MIFEDVILLFIILGILGFQIFWFPVLLIVACTVVLKFAKVEMKDRWWLASILIELVAGLVIAYLFIFPYYTPWP